VSEVRNASFRIDYRWEGDRLIQRRAWETPVGNVDARVIVDTEHGTDWTTKHYIETAEDYDVIQYLAEHTVFRSQEDMVRRRIADLGEDGIVFGRADRSPYQKLLVELVRPERLFMDLYERPGRVAELIEVLAARLDEQLERMMESSIRIVWQPDNITADLTPPDYFKKYCLPFYRRHGTRSRAAGKIYVTHIDGKAKALKDLIAEAPIDVVESFSLAEVSGDLPVPEALKAWPGKVICPNFPASLCSWPKDEIAAYLERLATDFGGCAPFALQISEDLPLDSYPSVLPLLGEFARHSNRPAR
jgi:hypothetical protein